MKWGCIAVGIIICVYIEAVSWSSKPLEGGNSDVYPTYLGGFVFIDY